MGGRELGQHTAGALRTVDGRRGLRRARGRPPPQPLASRPGRECEPAATSSARSPHAAPAGTWAEPVGRARTQSHANPGLPSRLAAGTPGFPMASLVGVGAHHREHSPRGREAARDDAAPGGSDAGRNDTRSTCGRTSSTLGNFGEGAGHVRICCGRLHDMNTISRLAASP